MHENFLTFLGENMQTFLSFTGFANATWGHIIMLLVGLVFIFLAIKYEFEPMLLIPIGFGILIGNIPFKDAGLQIGIYEEGSVLNILYQGVKQGWYPPLIFLGIGAMTDFGADLQPQADPHRGRRTVRHLRRLYRRPTVRF